MGKNIAGNIANILNQHIIFIVPLSFPQQEDGHNCGLWALDNAQKICEVLIENGKADNIDITQMSNRLLKQISPNEWQNIRSILHMH